MKKRISLVLALMILLSLCSFARAEQEPLHIEFWHTRGSGANYEVLKNSVDTFNATIGKEKGIFVEEIFFLADGGVEGIHGVFEHFVVGATIGKEKGIFVEEIFQGGYADIVPKLEMASQSGGMPAVGVTSGVRASILLDDGLLADMAPYAAKTGFDFSVFFESLLDVPGNENGQIRSLPYVRSTPVFYYNKTMADAKGLKAPETVAELEAFAKALNTYDPATGDGCWGFELLNDTTYLQGSFLWQLGQPLVGEGGTAPCLEGSLLKLFTDWTRWIDEGWCRPFFHSSKRE